MERMSAGAEESNAQAHPYHALDPAAVLALLGASANGLSAREAAERLARLGPNALPAARKRGPLRRLLIASSLNVEGFTGNRVALYAIAILVVVQLAFTYAPPANALFGTAPIDADEWLAIAALAAVLFLAVEAEKAWRRRAPP
jgi:magnesium-transporting ATPase (P-type)